MELEVRAELMDTGELKTEVEAMDAERKNSCLDSIVVGAQSLVESIRALLLRQEPAPEYCLQ